MLQSEGGLSTVGVQQDLPELNCRRQFRQGHNPEFSTQRFLKTSQTDPHPLRSCLQASGRAHQVTLPLGTPFVLSDGLQRAICQRTQCSGLHTQQPGHIPQLLQLLLVMLVCTGPAQTDLCRQSLITNLDPYGVMRCGTVAARLMQGIDPLIESVTQGFKTI